MDKVIVIALGIILLVIVVWYVGVVQMVFFSREIVIAPVQVVGKEDPDAKLGTAISAMLHGKLRQIQREMAALRQAISDESLETTADAPFIECNPVDDPAATFAVQPLTLPSIPMETELFEPADIQVSVSGVEVGGVFSWVQRSIVKSRTLQVTVYFVDDTHVRITADMKPFTGSDQDILELETRPDFDRIADAIAYAIIRRQIGPHQKNIQALRDEEVQVLLETLFTVADLNRESAFKRPVRQDISDLFPPIEAIAARAPNWMELTYFTASLASAAGECDKALEYYERYRDLATKPGAPDPPVAVETVDSKIQALELVLTPTVQSVAFRQEQFKRASEAYAKRLGLTPPALDIVFEMPEGTAENIIAYWDKDQQFYRVNPLHIDDHGLPEYTSLMGRFMRSHYEKCVEDGQVALSATFWNEFRYSAVQYILTTEPELALGLQTDQSGPLGAALGRFQNSVAGTVIANIREALGQDQDPMRRLMVRMLQEYDCDWTDLVLQEKMLENNQALGGLLPEDIIRSAFAVTQ